MVSEEERPLRLKRQLREQAVELAIQGRWQEAIEFNKAIVADYPQDVEAYNRLGKAYMELGDYQKSREAYNKTVEIDPHNAIARKNLQRLNYLKDEGVAGDEPLKIEPQTFIEEIGKAGIVNLVELAPWEKRVRLIAGDKVFLRPEGTTLVAVDTRGEYLGQVEPRHALRLLRLMAGGNEYSAAVISCAEAYMTIIIRETYQHPSQAGRLSFPPKGMEAVHPHGGERLGSSDYDKEGENESGYTIIGGEEVEVLPDESRDEEEDIIEEE